MAEARRTFGPVVLVGLGAAVLSAVAGTRAWLAVEDLRSTSGGQALGSTLEPTSSGEAPLAGALALVLLACWGVLLVTRGRVRRAMTWLGLLTAVGLLVTTVVSRFTLTDGFREELARLGLSDPEYSWTPWFWVALVGALLSLAATLAAVRLVGTWPEMGTRYDAPTGNAPARAADGDEADESQALWKAIDEGRDPTG